MADISISVEFGVLQATAWSKLAGRIEADLTSALYAAACM